MAAEYEILEKVKENLLSQARLDDFVLRQKGEVDSAVIVQNPHVSLYALDLESRQAVFVETPAEVDLCLATFYYIAQYEHAQRVLTVPFEEMIELGRDLPVDEERLVFIHSTGRAGSTLASQIFAQLYGVANISEPDALTDLVAYRYYFPQNTAELSALTDAAVRLLCNVQAPGGHVVKGRSFVIDLGDLFFELFPGAKNLFLYRDAKSYMYSSMRAYDDGVQRSEEEMRQFSAEIRAWLKTLLPTLARVPDEEPLTPAELIGYTWLSPMVSYLELHQAGVEMLAINFDSWFEAPRETAVAMLDYCGMLPEELAAVYAALERDSQAGTVLSKNAVKDHQQLRQLADPVELEGVLASHPLINSADFTAPNTLVNSKQ